MNTPFLESHHYAQLVASAISESVIHQRGYRSLSNPSEISALGFASSQLLPGLLVPIRSIHRKVESYQLRPDTPRSINGKPIKYESLPNRSPVIDVPAVVSTKLGDPQIPLWITEGAKKVDSAVSNGIACIGLPGVSGWRGRNRHQGITSLADWESIALNSRPIVVAFDSDVMEKLPVRRALDRFKALLERRGAKVSVLILSQLGSNEGKVGLDDAFARGATVGELQACIVQDLPPLWEAPPTFEMRPAPRWPTAAPAGTLGEMVSELSTATQTPVELSASMALGVLSATVQGRLSVSPKSNYVEPVNLYILTFLPSGSGKSAVVSELKRPLVRYESEKARDAAHEEATIESARKVLMKELSKVEQQLLLTDDGDSRFQLEARRNDLAARLEQTRRSTAPRLIVDDVTPEKLVEIMAQHGGCAAVISAEGGFFSPFIGRYSRGMRNLQTILAGHSGDSISVDRIGREHRSIEHPALTIAISPQPEIARLLGGVDEFKSLGGAARFLVSFPPSMIGFWNYRDAPSVTEKTRNAWQRLVLGLLEGLPPRVAETGITSEPFCLKLSAAASTEFWRFREEVEHSMRPGMPLSEITDWGSKLAGQTLRIAGLLHFANLDASDESTVTSSIQRRLREEISAETLSRAVLVARYYIAQAPVWFAALQGLRPNDDTKEILEVIRELARDNDRETTKRALHQAVHKRIRFRNASSLDAPLSQLVEWNWIRISERKTGGATIHDH